MAALARDHAPRLSRLPEAIVGRVRAKHEEQAERASEQRVRQRRDLRERDEAVEQAHGSGGPQEEEQWTRDALQYQRFRQRPH
eukprot:3549180-Prymnesium_polylepis.1